MFADIATAAQLMGLAYTLSRAIFILIRDIRNAQKKTVKSFRTPPAKKYRDSGYWDKEE